jgi:hypothetical protein
VQGRRVFFAIFQKIASEYGAMCRRRDPLWQVVKVNPELLALFVEVASFEPQRFSGLRNLTAVPIEFLQHRRALRQLQS